MNAKKFVSSLSKEQYEVVEKLWLVYCEAHEKYYNATKRELDKELKTVDEEWLFNMMIAVDNAEDFS